MNNRLSRQGRIPCLYSSLSLKTSLEKGQTPRHLEEEEVVVEQEEEEEEEEEEQEEQEEG